MAFGVNAVDPSLQKNVNHVVAPPKINEAKIDQSGQKQKMVISGQATGEERVCRAGDAVRYQNSGSWLSDCVGMACKAMERTPEVKEDLANQPTAKDPAIAAQEMALADNTKYTKEAEFNISPPTPGMRGGMMG